MCCDPQREGEEWGRKDDREGMKGGKERRRQGKEEKVIIMEEDRTIMLHVY